MVARVVAYASGFAALAAASLALAGLIDASVPLLIALLLAARAAAHLDEPDALARLASSVPVWTGVCLAAVVRAGSISVADVRGANAVAGLGIVRGNALFVAASWLAIVAAVIAASSIPSIASSRMDRAALGAQLVLIVTLFVGPQVVRAVDGVAWVAALAVLGIVAAFAGLFGRREWFPKLGVVVAAVAAALAFGAPKL